MNQRRTPPSKAPQSRPNHVGLVAVALILLYHTTQAVGDAGAVISGPPDQQSVDHPQREGAAEASSSGADLQSPRENPATGTAYSSVKRYPGFGGYTRRVTTDSSEAQEWFDQGMQLLYGYNHDEAIRSFERSAEVDPSCAMAWWGSAYARGLHINNPKMTAEQSRLAHEAAEKAAAATDRESPVEQALIGAVRRRYAWPAPDDRGPLDQRYADAMETVWHRFPDDPDVGALFAESLMNLQPWDLWTGAGAPKGRTLEIAAVLERTLSKQLGI